MLGSSILVLTAHRQTRRQVARALRSGGIEVRFAETLDEFRAGYAAAAHQLVIFDVDNERAADVESALDILHKSGEPPPVVLLSIGADKTPLVDLLERHEVSNLVAKHGAIRAVYPVLDERELLVTCEKVIRRDIFGVDKYVGSWGIVLHRDQITSVADKTPVLDRFERYLVDLDAPQTVVPPIVTVAEELILNAVVHAPHSPDGTPRYEALGPQPDLVLAPDEYVDVVYGCDGQRLMLSVTDHFGRLNKRTLHNYLTRRFDSDQIEAEMKPSGAGLGLSLSFRSIHQLIFNVHDSVRTEVIAGWYLRVSTASEFRQVGKSLNIFWLPKTFEPAATADTLPVRLTGRLDENTDYSEAIRVGLIDLREVSAITSRGLLAWLKFVRAMRGRRLEIVRCPELFVRMATEIAGVLQGVAVRSLLVPFECVACGREKTFERPLAEALAPTDAPCAECGQPLQFAGELEHYETFAEHLRA